jgi:hypothetical protein
LYGYFWILAAAVYLLLRKDIDDQEMDEIELWNERRVWTLPPLESTEGESSTRNAGDGPSTSSTAGPAIEPAP